jgi:pimeloyl-ACP methyl ester carboxylesterase
MNAGRSVANDQSRLNFSGFAPRGVLSGRAVRPSDGWRSPPRERNEETDDQQDHHVRCHLAAVQAATGATAVFGHSYGGFVALEAARRLAVFSHVAVYEPGVSIAGSIPVAWVPRYRQLLAAGDTRGAFAVFLRGSGAAPGPVTRLPVWYLRAVLRLMVSGEQWRRMNSFSRQALPSMSRRHG